MPIYRFRTEVGGRVGVECDSDAELEAWLLATRCIEPADRFRAVARRLMASTDADDRELGFGVLRHLDVGTPLHVSLGMSSTWRQHERGRRRDEALLVLGRLRLGLSDRALADLAADAIAGRKEMADRVPTQHRGIFTAAIAVLATSGCITTEAIRRRMRQVGK